ncbi:MAG: hypothetical protein ACLTXL_13325 [Clostridia bacterium]
MIIGTAAVKDQPFEGGEYSRSVVESMQGWHGCAGGLGEVSGTRSADLGRAMKI